MKTENGKNRPNWVLLGMVVISLGIHAVIFMRIAGLYHSDTRRVIELDLKEQKPWQRSIPRPRMHSEAPKVNDVNKIEPTRMNVPDMKIDPVEAEVPDTITEEISVPDTSGFSGEVAEWQPAAGLTEQYLTRKEYFDLLRLKIESRKKYPGKAKERQLEGRVVVGFTLDTDGKLASAEIVESSRHPSLDRAAIRAVKGAAPFPRPPGSLFDGLLRMKIAILFELT